MLLLYINHFLMNLLHIFRDTQIIAVYILHELITLPENITIIKATPKTTCHGIFDFPSPFSR